LRKDFQYVGQTFPNFDAAQKVTGQLIYGSDLTLPHMLYAKLLLSPIAHGLITKIDTSKAEAVPGVIKVFSHVNAPDQVYSRYRIIPGQDSCLADETLFAAKVRFVGDRVAAVVATSLEIARDAVELIEVEYEELPALITPEKSLQNKEVKIHPQGNLLHEYDLEVGEKCQPTADCLTVESTTKTQRIHHAAIDPHVCVADFDGSGKLTVWSPCQGVYGVRTVLANLFGLSYNQVRVIKMPMGGSFGGKQEFILEPVAAFMAMTTRQPVKLIFNREECIVATTSRPATTSTIKTTVTGDGKLQDFSVDTLFDAGAYASSSADNCVAMTKKITKLYRVPYYHHHCQVVYTNTPIAGGARGWGAPEIITAVEIQMDQVAKKLQMDPVELRLKNLVHPHDIDPASQYSVGNARVIDCLEQGAEAFNWEERYQRGGEQGRYRHGVGVACGAHKNGMFGGFPERSTMTLKMNEDGSFSLNASLHEMGCGTVISMKVIMAEVLGVNPDLISAGEADTEITPYDFGTYGSRVTYICGACARDTAAKMKERILESAAGILQKPQQYLQAEHGRVYVVRDGQQSLSYREIATSTQMKHNTDMIVTNTYNGISNPGSYSVQFAEVEVDTETGLTRVTDFLAVGDVGQAINRGMVEGQFQGAVQMGIGYALCEEIKIDERGRTVNNSFKKYHLVNAPDMPDVQVLMIEHEGDDGPFGAKSVGEIATVPTAAAVINAVNHALGTTLTDMPLTPEKILAAIK
jgi:CO/xanthine dehydrogenase Mo-binding subunit